MLTGYRMMWVMVMFDLPVVTKPERKAATRFRNDLLDFGFEMAQFSVYMRFCSGKEMAATITKQVEESVPDGGKVHILYFTDKQYENIVSFRGKEREKAWKNPEQFALF